MHLGLVATLGPVELSGEKSGHMFTFDFSATWQFNNNNNPYRFETLETALEGGFASFPGIVSSYSNNNWSKNLH